LAGSLACLLAASCANNDANQVDPPTAVAMNDKVAPAYQDGETTIYQVQTPVQLPVRKPTADEAKGLGKSEPYPHAPFLLASDLRIEIRFTLSNLDDKEHAVELLVDPWNEFVRYRPKVEVINDEETQPDFSGFDKFFLLPPKSRVQGALTPDDTQELEIDLATVEGIAAKPPTGADANVNGLFNHVFNIQNRSNAKDPLIAPYLPKVVPGLTGFDLGLRSGEAANVAVEVIVDVQDLNGNRSTTTVQQEMGVPSAELQPPAAATMD